MCVVAIVMYHFVARYELQEPLPYWLTLLTHRLHFTDIFFMLSGFLMMHCYQDRLNGKEEILRFYGKRLVRLYPAHVTMLLAFALFAAALRWVNLMPLDAGERYGQDAFLRQLFLIHAWWPGQQAAWNYPSWAISAVMGCFLLFPSLAVLLRQRWRSFYALLVAFCLLSIAASYGFKGASPMTLTFDAGIIRGLMSFLLGMALWHGWHAGKIGILSRWGSLVLVGVIMVVMVQTTWPPELLLPAYMLLIGGLAHTQTGWLARLRPLGKYSYSLLLVHALIGTTVLGGAERFMAVTPESYIALYMPIALIFSLTGAALLYHLVELPSVQWIPVLLSQVSWGKKQKAEIIYLAPPKTSEMSPREPQLTETQEASSAQAG